MPFLLNIKEPEEPELQMNLVFGIVFQNEVIKRNSQNELDNFLPAKVKPGLLTCDVQGWAVAFSCNIVCSSSKWIAIYADADQTYLVQTKATLQIILNSFFPAIPSKVAPWR